MANPSTNVSSLVRHDVFGERHTIYGEVCRNPGHSPIRGSTCEDFSHSGLAWDKQRKRPLEEESSSDTGCYYGIYPDARHPIYQEITEILGRQWHTINTKREGADFSQLAVQAALLPQLLSHKLDILTDMAARRCFSDKEKRNWTLVWVKKRPIEYYDQIIENGLLYEAVEPEFVPQPGLVEGTASMGLQYSSLREQKDFRYHLLADLIHKFLSNRLDPFKPYELEPKEVEKFSDLSLGELIRRTYFYLYLEQAFSFTDGKLKGELLVRIQRAALKRLFFSKIYHFETPAEMIDVLMIYCVDILTRYPHLQKNFKQIYENIAGMRELKITLFLDVIYPWYVPEEARRYNVSPPSGILLYGPPGCGKTHIAKTLAGVSNFHFIEYSSGTHGSIYLHGAALGIQKVFDEAKKHKPSIIFIDEVSSIFPRRDQLGGEGVNREEEVSQFLRLMEGCARDGVLVFCATNYPEKIDPAILRTGRLDKKFYLPPPHTVTRKALFEQYIRKIQNVSPTIDFQRLADLTNNFISSDIRAVVENAARQAMHHNVSVDMKYLEDEISRFVPSLTNEIISSFERARLALERT